MTATLIINVALVTTLLTPICLALVLAISYFFTKEAMLAERFTSHLVSWFFSIMLLANLVAVTAWLAIGMPAVSLKLAQFNICDHFLVDFRLYYDSVGLIFLLTQVFITNLISFYSHRYLHRDPYYRRFFIIISLFSFGMTLITLSGTMDLIFAGWELMSLSSFLLISYFWHRPKAIAAATRAYYIYRFCDLGLLSVMLITHMFWHDINLFTDLAHVDHNSVLSHVPNTWRWLLSLGILLPVVGKSAQVPFCFWLPKAMEGPTHSSAIFYGSLSIHAGVFLLIRAMPIWYNTPGFSFVLAAVGITSALIATLCAHVQSNIKGQIGYASIAQVGIMLIELSLGFHDLALFHMIGNALLRCFQLLVSSSILTTHLHMTRTVKIYSRLYDFSPLKLIPKKLLPSLYVFAINDGYLDYIIKTWVAKPLLACARFINRAVNRINFAFSRPQVLSSKAEIGLTMFSAPLIAAFLIVIILDLSKAIVPPIRLAALILSLIFAFASLGEIKNPKNCLTMAIFSSLLSFLSLAYGENGSVYAVGLFSSSLMALDALKYIMKRMHIPDLNTNSGALQQFPAAANLLLIGILGIIAFPLTATYFGEEIMLSIAVDAGWYFLFTMFAIFVINGIALIRMYAITMFGSRDNYSCDLDLDLSHSQTFIRLLLLLAGYVSAFAITHL